MYQENQFLEIPDNEEQKIWRYMDLSKFIYILEKKSLFFTRSDKFEDKFEGSYPKTNKEQRPDIYQNIIPEISNNELNQFLHNFSTINEKLRKNILINCWHINNFESAAMWNLYSKSNEAIAIQSTFLRFRDSFNNAKETVCIGKVKYIDYKTQVIPENNFYSPFVYKRLSFEHENEIRAIVQKIPVDSSRVGNLDIELCDYGDDINVDIDTLIDKIYVSPLAPKWFYELVQAIVKRYKLDKEVMYSDLNQEPVF